MATEETTKRTRKPLPRYATKRPTACSCRRARSSALRPPPPNSIPGESSDCSLMEDEAGLRLTSIEDPYGAPYLFSISKYPKKLKFLLQWNTEMGDPFSVWPPCCSKYRKALATTETVNAKEREGGRERERVASAAVLPPHHPLSSTLLHATAEPKPRYSVTAPAMSSSDVIAAPVISSPEVITAVNPKPKLHHQRPDQALRPFNSVSPPTI
jgi:hypothetical protein